MTEQEAQILILLSVLATIQEQARKAQRGNVCRVTRAQLLLIEQSAEIAISRVPRPTIEQEKNL